MSRALDAAIKQAEALVEQLKSMRLPGGDEVETEKCPNCGAAWATEGPDFADAGDVRVCARCNGNFQLTQER